MFSSRLKITLYKLLQLIFMLILLTIVYQNCWDKSALLTSNSTAELSKLSDADLIQIMNTLIVEPVKEINQKEKLLARFGAKIFDDLRFSTDQKVACASCHIKAKFFGDGLALPNIRVELARNTPTIVNSRFYEWQFWDGRADSLISQIRGPLESDHEQFSNWTLVAKTLFVHYKDEYENLFDHKLSSKILELNDALPKPTPKRLSPKLSAFSIKTASDFSIQNKFILDAQKFKSQPQDQLHQFINPQPSEPLSTWYLNYDLLNKNTKIELKNIMINVGISLASFQSSLVAIDSSFDRFVTRVNSSSSIIDSLNSEFGLDELEGFKIFIGKGQCLLCHSGPHFTDQSFHNIGLQQQKNLPLDIGRAAAIHLLKNDNFRCLSKKLSYLPKGACEEIDFLDENELSIVGAFKTPSLRNIEHTAPYFHDGSHKDLDSVIDFYSQLSEKPAVGERELSLRPFKLSKSEKKQLKAFILSLSSEITDLSAD